MAKILVVDDNEDILEFIREMLNMFEYSSVTAESGEKALDLLAGGQKFDLVISDINMPGISGIEMTEKIKKINPAMPVIIMTGYGDKEIIGKQTGDEFIKKPFEIGEMMDLVKKYV